jgi:hypothetical protein
VFPIDRGHASEAGVTLGPVVIFALPVSVLLLFRIAPVPLRYFVAFSG